MPRKLLMFDCFNTVFNMSTLPKGEMASYVAQVRSTEPWRPLELSEAWKELQAHLDAAEGLKQLRMKGYSCVPCSNGPAELLKHISEQARITWDVIIGLEEIQVYKPNPWAYTYIHTRLNFPVTDVVMVTANRTFGDLEAASKLGMSSQLIRDTDSPKDLIALAAIYPDISGEG